MFDVSTRANPVLKWAGGKSALLERILSRFPSRFGRYIEPFLGGGAMFLALRPGVPAILNDANPELVILYRVVRDEPEALMRALDRHAAKYSAKYFADLRAKVPRTPVAKAARLIFLNKTCFNGLYRLNASGKFNVPFGHRAKCPALYRRENVLEVSGRLRRVSLRMGDFAKALASARKGDLVYCDPPYVPLSKTSSFKSYTAVGFSEKDQTRLRDACVRAAKRGATVFVSNSSAPIIFSLYEEWEIYRLRARRAINSKAHLRGSVDETLIILRPPRRRLRPARRKSTD